MASLLAKKTAKQAKARWHEFLDPRIHASDWKPEEDAKLLNLARLLPNQWRSIASTLGRTATQCVERYQRLLDDTAGISGEGNDLGLSGPGIETLASVGGSKELQIGDLNVDAETKEARPDSVDLDDDEKEMISEARARLANTKGKKATRKAREKMLEESKRIALLQKRRDLKQAGITTKLKAPKKNYATQKDYNADVVFEHRPVEGFYDTSEETQTNVNQLHNFERKVNSLGLKDESTKKDKRPRNHDKKSTAGDIEKAPVLANAEQFKRRKLELPEPEFNKDEMDQLAKKDDVEISVTLASKVTREETSENKIKAAAEKLKEYTSVKSSLLTTEEPDLETVTTDDTVQDVVVKAKKEKAVSLRDRLAALPKPKNDFEIILDDEPESTNAPITTKPFIVEDEGEKERLRQVKESKEREAALLRRSQAVQKGLPIPKLDASFIFEQQLDSDKEFIKIVRSDFAKAYKVSGAPLVADLDQTSREIVMSEMKELVKEKELMDFQKDFIKYHQESYKLDVNTSSLITELQSLVENCNGLEKTLGTQLGGYIQRNDMLTEKNITLLEELKDVDRAQSAFQMLYSSELIAIEQRQETLKEEVDKLVNAEQRAQEVLLGLRRQRTSTQPLHP